MRAFLLCLQQVEGGVAEGGGGALFAAPLEEHKNVR